MNRSEPDGAGLFDASPNPYLVLDRRLDIVAANPAYLRATGRRLDDIVGRWAWDGFPTDPETLRRSVDSFQRVLRTGEPDVMPLLRFDLVSENGTAEERYWSIVHSPVLDANGEVSLVLQHPIDVTELQHLRDEFARRGEVSSARLEPAHGGIFERAQAAQEANRSLRAEIERLRALFEKAPGFTVILTGPDHVIEMANEAYQDLVGRRDLVGRPLPEALPEIVDQPFVALLDEVWRTRRAYVGRAVRAIVHRDGGARHEERFVDFVYQPLLDDDGEPWGILSQGHDVTEHQRLVQELREADARKNEFLATLAHELRNPLAPLLNVSGLLRRCEPSAAQAPLLEILGRQIAQLRRLVDDLLEVSRVTHGRVALRREPMRVSGPVYAALEAIQPALAQRRQVSETRVSSTATVDVDAARITQIVTNLLDNASKFTPEGGRVALEVRDEADAVVVSVCDEGIGIAPEVLPRVFDLFTQGAATVPEKAQSGLGIGLCLVRRLVQLHGGSVEAASEGTGRGACFTVRLPRVG